MSILIKEKDILFLTINLITFLASLAYLMLDFLALQSQIMAGNDPAYIAIEIGLAIIRAEAHVVFILILVVTIGMDVWWGLRIIRAGRRRYWKENL